MGGKQEKAWNYYRELLDVYVQQALPIEKTNYTPSAYTSDEFANVLIRRYFCDEQKVNLFKSVIDSQKLCHYMCCYSVELQVLLPFVYILLLLQLLFFIVLKYVLQNQIYWFVAYAFFYWPKFNLFLTDEINRLFCFLQYYLNAQFFMYLELLIMYDVDVFFSTLSSVFLTIIK